MGVRGNATLRSRHYGAIFNGGDASASSFFFCLFFFLHKKSGGSHPQSLEEWTCVAVANRNQRKKRFLQIHGSESETSIPRVKYITEKRKKQKKICIHRKSNEKCPLLSFSLFCLQQKNASKRRLSAGAQTENLSPAAPLQIFSASPLQLAGKRSRPPSFRPSPVGRGKNGNRRQM